MVMLPDNGGSKVVSNSRHFRSPSTPSKKVCINTHTLRVVARSRDYILAEADLVPSASTEEVLKAALLQQGPLGASMVAESAWLWNLFVEASRRLFPNNRTAPLWQSPAYLS